MCTAADLGLEIAAPTLAECRRDFARIQAAADFSVGRDAFRAAVAAELADAGLTPATATPAAWVHAATVARVVCPKCGGSGKYQPGAFGLPDKRRPVAGPCYACEGSGEQGHDDYFRNRTFWGHWVARAMAGG